MTMEGFGFFWNDLTTRVQSVAQWSFTLTYTLSFHWILFFCVNSLQNLDMQMYQQTSIFHARGTNTVSLQEAPLNWQHQAEDEPPLHEKLLSNIITLYLYRVQGGSFWKRCLQLRSSTLDGSPRGTIVNVLSNAATLIYHSHAEYGLLYIKY